MPPLQPPERRCYGGLYMSGAVIEIIQPKGKAAEGEEEAETKE